MRVAQPSTRCSTGRAAGPEAASRSRRRSRLFARTVQVVDASVLVVALADDGADGDRAGLRLRGEELVAPELIDLEVASVLRKQVAAGSGAARSSV
jgi:hypothetical protein